MTTAADMHDGAVEALRFVLLAFNDEADPTVTYTLSGPAGSALIEQVLILLRMLAAYGAPEGADPDEFIRRYLAGLIEEHTLRALDDELATPG